MGIGGVVWEAVALISAYTTVGHLMPATIRSALAHPAWPWALLFGCFVVLWWEIRHPRLDPLTDRAVAALLLESVTLSQAIAGQTSELSETKVDLIAKDGELATEITRLAKHNVELTFQNECLTGRVNDLSARLDGIISFNVSIGATLRQLLHTDVLFLIADLDRFISDTHIEVPRQAEPPDITRQGAFASALWQRGETLRVAGHAELEFAKLYARRFSERVATVVAELRLANVASERLITEVRCTTLVRGRVSMNLLPELRRAATGLLSEAAVSGGEPPDPGGLAASG